MLTPEQTRAAELNKQATALKKAGDINGAVAVLQQIKDDAGPLYQETRLAKFLQQAGRVDEALAEIQWLLDHSHVWAQTMFGHQPVAVVQCQRAVWCEHIHADAALICKRAKRPNQQAHHEELQQRYGAIRQRLRPLADADMKAKRKAFEAAKTQGPGALSRFIASQVRHT